MSDESRDADQVDCPDCEGTGTYSRDVTCRACHGTGTVTGSFARFIDRCQGDFHRTHWIGGPEAVDKARAAEKARTT